MKMDPAILISVVSIFVAVVGTASGIYYARKGAGESYVRGLEARIVMIEADCSNCQKKLLACDEERSRLEERNYKLMDRLFRLEGPINDRG